MNITIKSIDTKPGADQYNNFSATYTELWLDPQTGEVEVSQEYRTNSTSFALWHSVELSWKVEGHPLESIMREYLESDEVQERLLTICHGHEVVWDGSNMVGKMADEAIAARDSLENELGEIWLGDDNNWQFWAIDEWLVDIDVTAAMAQQYEADAEIERVVLSGDVDVFLIARRDELREEAEEAEYA